MSDKPLEVGEIGVLQNMNTFPSGEAASYMNGMIAEVTEPLGNYYVSGGEHYLYGVICEARVHDTHFWVHPHEIRRISNPDAEQFVEQEKVVVV